MWNTLRFAARRGSWMGHVCLALALWGCGDDGHDGDLGEAVGFTAAMETAPGTALTLTPLEPLRGGRVYAVVVSTDVRTADGEPLRPPPAFAAMLGVEPDGRSPSAIAFDEDPARGGPFPDGRLVNANGTVRIPDRIAFRGLAIDTSETQQARAFLRGIADEAQSLRGFSTTSPVRIETSVPLDLGSLTADSLLFFERTDGALDLDGLIAAAARRGIAPADIALGVSFPTQPIGDDLRAVRSRLIERASSSPPRLVLQDDDLDDDLDVGVFTRSAPGAFAALLADYPDVAFVAHGIMRSPDFLGANERMDARKISGEVPADEVALDVVITLPHGDGAHPVVLLQHGFGGNNLTMLPNAAALASRGIATAAISAVQHGRRGSPVALLDSTPLQTRDIFRQTNSDQMQLVRLIESGVDIDGDGATELAPSGIGYHGVSLGGLLGANLVAVEDAIDVAVLTVAGGRIAGLGQAPAIKPLYAQFFAERAGLPVDSAMFAVVLDRLLELGQLGMDDGDGLNYARWWHREPFAGAAKRVLLQEGVGDEWVLNEHTEELARAAGIPAQVAATNAAGVCGLWRFDPRDPPQGHGISARPEVRAQAVRFLASGGTEIVEYLIKRDTLRHVRPAR